MSAIFFDFFSGFLKCSQALFKENTPTDSVLKVPVRYRFLIKAYRSLIYV